ncbi:MAG: dephospho-CoA kinase [Lachnospiraceae bacterium]
MRIIGITGGIGTGKSTLLKLLKEEYGAYIVETDKLAHELMQPGQSAYNRIIQVFGADILYADGTIDRRKLGDIVFQNKTELETLNGIVHPAVKEYILEDIEKKREEGTVFYVIEAALLIEDGYKAICDEIWYIYVEREERLKRLVAGRGGKREKYESVIANQSSDEYYRQYCDVVIDNGKTLEKTANVVKELLSKSR